MDQPPLFGGEAGEPVPQVDPEDVKAAWGVGGDMERSHPGGQYGIDVRVFEAPANPVRIFRQSATGE